MQEEGRQGKVRRSGRSFGLLEYCLYGLVAGVLVSIGYSLLLFLRS